MSTVIEHKKFSCTELGSNHNKFWNVTLYDNNDVMSEWGRQGKTSQSKTWHGVGRSFMEKKIAEKHNKGYHENHVVEGTSFIQESGVRAVNTDLKDIAVKQIRSKNPVVTQLIDFLVKVNAHAITQATGGQIQYNTDSATFKTTQGVVIPSQVVEARNLLSSLYDSVKANDYSGYDFEDNLNKYLSLIPRDFGMKRMSPREILPDISSIQKENDILDGLDASFAGLQASDTKAKKIVKKKAAPKIFDVDMDLIEKGQTFNRINSYYEKTKKSMHTSCKYRLKKVYEINIKTVSNAFKEYGYKLGNIKELFHGTKCSSCLSILRQGLIIPPASSSHCTGRLYGNGVYASDISSKALNYATNFWGNQGSTDRIFMFLVDFAMGKTYYPTNKYGTTYPPKGFDSTFAKAGQAGVYNNEMIVYNCSQVNLKYLLEFE